MHRASSRHNAFSAGASQAQFADTRVSHSSSVNPARGPAAMKQRRIQRDEAGADAALGRLPRRMVLRRTPACRWHRRAQRQRLRAGDRVLRPPQIRCARRAKPAAEPRNGSRTRTKMFDSSRSGFFAQGKARLYVC